MKDRGREDESVMVREKTVCRPVTTQCLRGHLRKNGQQSVYEYTYPVTHTQRDRHRCVCVFIAKLDK